MSAVPREVGQVGPRGGAQAERARQDILTATPTAQPANPVDRDSAEAAEIQREFRDGSV
jgi:hypothetical protein